MGLHIEGVENVYTIILIILFSTLGKYLDNHPMGGYGCPDYCGADHKHVMQVDGYISDTRALRDTCSSNDSLWVFHLEAESVDSE